MGNDNRIFSDLSKTIIEASDDCYKIIDQNGILISISNSSLNILEINSESDVLGKSWIEFWESSEDREHAKVALRNAAEVGRGQFEGYFSTPSGLRKWWDVVITPIKNDKDVNTVFLAVLRDITSKKETSARMLKLQLIASRLSQGLDIQEVSDILLGLGKEVFNADNGIFLTKTSDGQQLKVLSSLNYSEELVASWQSCPASRELPVPHALRTGETVYLENPKEMIEKFPELEQIMDLSGIKAFVAIPLKVKDKVIAAVGFAFQMPQKFEDPAKEFVTMVANQCAISIERSFLYDSEIVKNDELQRTLIAKDSVVRELTLEREIRERLIAALSHDLRTPLASCKLSAQVMQKQLQEEKHLRMCDRIVSSMNRADEMIRDLLDASLLKAGQRIPVNLSSFPLEEVVASTVDMLSEMHGPRVSFENSGGMMVGKWDHVGIQRVIENLVGNAVKYGGPTSAIVVRMSKSASSAVISVHNSGGVINQEDQKLLFEAYQRPGSGSDNKKSGWGLGLTLVKGISEAMGGSVRVTSTVEEGTVFTIELPFKT